ncbi:hypothetical protein PIB30_038246 [Stylosanthes scabra]|uniref:Uncharacterized protein n=1 Tax=Stylosanthes scabra TaxID=79078 RepID=A0ABU6VDI0_9FABA|nr:hypothetical protein [Stylosanthes scabra]
MANDLIWLVLITNPTNPVHLPDHSKNVHPRGRSFTPQRYKMSNPSSGGFLLIEKRRSEFQAQSVEEEPKESQKEQRSKENGQKAKKRAQLSVDRAPASSRRRARARALLSLIWKFPLVARPRNPEDAPAPPHFVTTKTRTSRARVMEMACPRGDDRFT